MIEKTADESYYTDEASFRRAANRDTPGFERVLAVECINDRALLEKIISGGDEWLSESPVYGSDKIVDLRETARERLARMKKIDNNYSPKESCPKCASTDIEYRTNAGTTEAARFFTCKSCSYKWWYQLYGR